MWILGNIHIHRLTEILFNYLSELLSFATEVYVYAWVHVEHDHSL